MAISDKTLELIKSIPQGVPGGHVRFGVKILRECFAEAVTEEFAAWANGPAGGLYWRRDLEEAIDSVEWWSRDIGSDASDITLKELSLAIEALELWDYFLTSQRNES